MNLAHSQVYEITSQFWLELIEGLCLIKRNIINIIIFADALFETENTLFASAIHILPKPASRRNSTSSG